MAFTDFPLFDRLVAEILRMQGPDDKWPIPDPAAAGSWDRAYARYRFLLDHEAREQYAARPQAEAHAAEEPRWAAFLENRDSTLAALNRGAIDWELMEYLGVKPNDLDEPGVPPNKYGSRRHADWENRAWRLSDALSTWRCLSSEERRVLRYQIIERRLSNG
jgi:hypothetical protein